MGMNLDFPEQIRILRSGCYGRKYSLIDAAPGFCRCFCKLLSEAFRCNRADVFAVWKHFKMRAVQRLQFVCFSLTDLNKCLKPKQLRLTGADPAAQTTSEETLHRLDKFPRDGGEEEGLHQPIPVCPPGLTGSGPPGLNVYNHLESS